jgi:hypothetical protein
MESELPIYGHSETDFRKAVRLYVARFSSQPPGSGHTDARYQMIRSALDLSTKATPEDLKRWESEISALA